MIKFIGGASWWFSVDPKKHNPRAIDVVSTLFVSLATVVAIDVVSTPTVGSSYVEEMEFHYVPLLRLL